MASLRDLLKVIAKGAVYEVMGPVGTIAGAKDLATSTGVNPWSGRTHPDTTDVLATTGWDDPYLPASQGPMQFTQIGPAPSLNQATKKVSSGTPAPKLSSTQPSKAKAPGVSPADTTLLSETAKRGIVADTGDVLANTKGKGRKEVVDPIALQIAFASAAQPILRNILSRVGDMNAIGTQVRNQDFSRLPAQFQDFARFRANQQANDLAQLGAGLAQSTIARPQYDARMDLLDQLRSAQEQYYQLQAQTAAERAAASSTSSGSGEDFATKIAQLKAMFDEDK